MSNIIIKAQIEDINFQLEDPAKPQLAYLYIYYVKTVKLKVVPWTRHATTKYYNGL